jgi:hypothetical protein
MSEANTDRITPLPWFVDVCNSGESCWCRTIGNKEGNDSNEHCIAPSGTLKAADAAYIVHACNTLPKLEALNAELLKKTEYALFMVQQYSKEHPLFNEMVAELEDLIKRAKGMVSNG